MYFLSPWSLKTSKKNLILDHKNKTAFVEPKNKSKEIRRKISSRSVANENIMLVIAGNLDSSDCRGFSALFVRGKP